MFVNILQQKSKKALTVGVADLLVIKNIPENELDEFKSIDPEYYNYYMKGISFFDSLSNKVKEIYTINELWYIYVFDQELKSKLLTVK